MAITIGAVSAGRFTPGLIALLPAHSDVPEFAARCGPRPAFPAPSAGRR
ncbi:hypothetical protein [Rugosimonospora acidiphila]